MFNFKGKKALVTGGTDGIGFATAMMLTRMGAVVAIAGRRQNSGNEAFDHLAAIEPGSIFVPGDVSVVSDCRRLVEDSTNRLGSLDILINCAGVFMNGPIDSVTESDYHHVMDINVKGTFFMCQAALPEIRRSGGGAIVNVSSDSGITGNTEGALYCASKGAVTIFTKALAVDVAKENIRVNCVCPGDVHTPMLEREAAAADNPLKYMDEMVKHYPVGRVGKPEEVAAAICFLASEACPFVIGAALSIDGGLTAFSY